VARTASSYSPLGLVLDDLARRRNVRGPTSIARHIKNRMGYGPSPSAWQQILTGETKNPERKNIKQFADAFELSSEERVRLAWVYVYGEEPPRGV
jgi:hypothetical protein